MRSPAIGRASLLPGRRFSAFAPPPRISTLMDEREHPDLPTTPEALGALQPPPASAAPSNGGAAAGDPHNTVRGIKETIESILIAFILAFVFRAFVVEAFVI